MTSHPLLSTPTCRSTLDRVARVLLPALLAAASIALAPEALRAQESGGADRLRLERCSVEGVAGEVRCGTFRVPEDRGEEDGRNIDLAVTVLRATGPDPAPDPVIYLVGGPGAAATGVDAAFENLPRLRRRRDVVLVDQRGTGDSNRLDCDCMWGGPGASFTETFLPVDRVRACREELEERSDLGEYTTPVAMDDLDELRQALEYGQVNLWGGSYGTRAALMYLRRHGEHVRSVILAGPDLSFRYGSAAVALAADGMYLSVDCAEVVARIDSADLIRVDSTSFLRGDRARQRVRACSEWPRAGLPPGFHEPVGGRVPTLVLTGGLDPTIPVGWTRTVTRWLRDSRRVVFPNRGHELGPNSADGCMRGIVTDFLADPVPERLDASCTRDPDPLDFPSPDGR